MLITYGQNFETTCRWHEDANEVAALAMLNEIIYSLPDVLKPFARKVFAFIVDWDIIYYCQLEKLGPYPVLRSIAYDIFGLCSLLIRNFGVPRLSAYKRIPNAPNKKVSS